MVPAGCRAGVRSGRPVCALGGARGGSAARLRDWGREGGTGRARGGEASCAGRCVSRCDPACVTPPVAAGVALGRGVCALNP